MLTIKVRDDYSESWDFYDNLKKEHIEIEDIVGREGTIGPDVVISMISSVCDALSTTVPNIITKIVEYKKGVAFEVQKDGVTISGRVSSPEELEAYLNKIKPLLS